MCFKVFASVFISHKEFRALFLSPLPPYLKVMDRNKEGTELAVELWEGVDQYFMWGLRPISEYVTTAET